jgi:AbrB family looped-hinge helix DNA binding protein
MATHSKIGQAGRIVLPKSVRDELRLSPGDSLEVECSEGRALSCVPCEEEGAFTRSGESGS